MAGPPFSREVFSARMVAAGLIVACAVLFACEGFGSGRSGGSSGAPVAAVHELVGAASPADAGCMGARDTLITSAGIGPVRIWMSADRLRTSCGARDTTLAMLEGTTLRAMAVGDSTSIIVAMARDGPHPIIERAFTRSSVYRTRSTSGSSGSGVGSTLRDLHSAGPRLCLISGGESLLVTVAGGPGVLMSVPLDSAVVNEMVTRREIIHMYDTAQVSEVWLDGLAAACQ